MRNIIVIYLETPSGTHQVSWHIHDDELPLFEWLPLKENAWDGHTTDEKYKWLAQIALPRGLS